MPPGPRWTSSASRRGWHRHPAATGRADRQGRPHRRGAPRVPGYRRRVGLEDGQGPGPLRPPTPARRPARRRHRTTHRAARRWWRPAAARGGKPRLVAPDPRRTPPQLTGGRVPPVEAYHRVRHPTLGEHHRSSPGTAVNQPSRRQPSAGRLAAEDACRTALADRPRLARRFTRLLATAQRYATIREEQARALTLGWPLLR